MLEVSLLVSQGFTATQEGMGDTQQHGDGLTAPDGAIGFEMDEHMTMCGGEGQPLCSLMGSSPTLGSFMACSIACRILGSFIAS